MDIETVFLNVFSIKKKPDIIQLIKASIQVAALKHPTKFKKHRDEILMMLLNPENHDVGDEEIDSCSDIEEDEEVDSSGGAEFSVDDLHHKEKSSQEVDQETCHILRRQGNNNISKTESTVLKVKLSLKKARDIDDKVQHDDSDKEKKTEAEKCPSDKTKSKNMSCVTGSATKKSLGDFRKMKEDISRVEDKQLLSDCSPQIKRLEGGEQLKKQSNSSVVTRPMRKVTQSSTVARPMQKTTQSIMDMKGSGMKFESSKRKFEERVAEQNKAKRRIIMVDFHDMPKPAKDSCAPKRCWDRRRRF